jgi:hypothetical protein
MGPPIKSVPEGDIESASLCQNVRDVPDCLRSRTLRAPTIEGYRAATVMASLIEVRAGVLSPDAKIRERDNLKSDHAFLELTIHNPLASDQERFYASGW